MPNTDPLLTQEEAARIVRCSAGKLAKERYLGRLAYIPGRPVLLKLSDVLDWLDRRRVAAAVTVAMKTHYHPVRAGRLAALRKVRTRRPPP